MHPDDNLDPGTRRKLVVALAVIFGLLIAMFVAYFFTFSRFEPASNNANRSANASANANANRPRSTPFTRSGNSTSNVSNTAAPSPPPPTALGLLSGALKERLISDHPEVLTSTQWNSDLWHQLPIGRFYPNVQRSRDVVVQVTNGSLAKSNQKLTGGAVTTLRNSISMTTKGKACVEAMVEAVRHTEPIHIP